MATCVLNGDDIRGWFQLGLQEVHSHRKQLNAINVFPVADGDTGNNLMMTLRSMVGKVQPTRMVGRVLQNMSESGLAHARGNSGLIFASFVRGMAEAGQSYETANLEEFTHMARRASDHVYHTLDNPREGTMLTVIREWAAFLDGNHQRYQSFNELVEAAFEVAQTSLKKTMEMMDVLRKNKVVDSGAAGFVRFLHGLNRHLRGETAETSEVAEAIPETLPETEDGEAVFRYCTEALLSAPDLREEDLQYLLRDLGDSLIVSRAGDAVRVHLHTDTPWVMFDRLAPLGQICEQKADDMRLQFAVMHHRRSAVALVTDSIADLPQAYLLEHQIHVIPMTVLMEDTVWLDKLTLFPGDMFRRVREGSAYPTSSQPEPEKIRERLNFIADHYPSVLIITVAEKLSATYRAIRSEAMALERQGIRVEVLDSRLNSGAQGLVVREAAEVLAAGGSMDEALSRARALIPRTRILVCLDTIAWAVRSGRVPDTIGRIGMAIGARPVMTLDKEGKGAAFGAGFSKKGMTRKIMGILTRVHKKKGVDAYAITHCGQPELAEAYAAALTAITGKAPAFVTEISAVTAMHAGDGAVAVSFVEGSDA